MALQFTVLFMTLRKITEKQQMSENKSLASGLGNGNKSHGDHLSGASRMKRLFSDKVAVSGWQTIKCRP